MPKGGHLKRPIGHRDDVAEGIADAARLVREIHESNKRHAREQFARSCEAGRVIARMDRAFRRARAPELAARQSAPTRRGHLHVVGE